MKLSVVTVIQTRDEVIHTVENGRSFAPWITSSGTILQAFIVFRTRYADITQEIRHNNVSCDV
jgi:hypothetical protein